MSDEERADWNNGMTIEEIIDKYGWHVPPEPPAELIH